MNRLLLIVSLFAGWPKTGLAQASSWRTEASGTTVPLFGLSVVSAQVAWASGTKGTVVRTIDGEHWTAMQVPGADKLELP